MTLKEFKEKYKIILEYEDATFLKLVSKDNDKEKVILKWDDYNNAIIEIDISNFLFFLMHLRWLLDNDEEASTISKIKEILNDK